MPSFVQYLGGNDTSAAATTEVITVSGTTTLNNVVLLWARIGGSFSLSSVADSKGNTWHIDVAGAATGTNSFLASAVMSSPLTTGDTITVTWSASAAGAIGAAEFSGIAVSGGLASLDQSANIHSTTSAITVATTVNSVGGGLVISCAAGSTQAAAITLNSATDPDSGGAWVNTSEPGGGVDAAYQIAPASPSLYSCAWTAGATNSDACIAVYKAATSGSSNAAVTPSSLSANTSVPTPTITGSSGSTGGGTTASSTSNFIALPDMHVAVGFTPDNPTGPSGLLILDDPTYGQLDGGTLASSIDWTDITEYVVSFDVSRSSTRTQGPLWNYEAGTCSIVLDNSDGRFDPDNAMGPYVDAGESQVTPMVPVKISATFGSESYDLFTGFADSWVPADFVYDGDYVELTLSATDAFKVLSQITLPTIAAEGAGAYSGDRVKDILQRANWYTSLEWQSIDQGDHQLQATTLGSDALSLMRLAADSEVGQLYINGSGAVVFRARSAITTNTRSTTVQAVFGDYPGTTHPAGTEIPYSVVSRACDDTEFANDIQATRVNGTLQEVKDTNSIAKYLFPRTYARTDLILQTDSDALAWAEYVLSVSTRLINRIDSIEIDPVADGQNLWPQVLGREIGDLIQIWVRPPYVISESYWSETNQGVPPTNDYFIIPQSQGKYLRVGDRFQLFTADGTLKESTRFMVTDIADPYAGYQNISFTPNSQQAPQTGDIVTECQGFIKHNCYITGIFHTWDGLKWTTKWTLDESSSYTINYLTLNNATTGQLDNNVLS